MSRPKLNINHVWVLEEILPYEGSEILGIFVNPEVAKEGRKGWWQTPEGDFSTAPRGRTSYEPFFAVTKYQIRTK